MSAEGAPAIDADRRYPIARGAVRRLGLVLTLFLVALAANLGLAFGLAPQLFGGGVVPGIAAAGSGLLTVALLVYLNLRGSIDVGTDGVQIDWRSERRFLPYDAMERADVYREHGGGKKLVGVAIALAGASAQMGDTVKVPLGEDHFGEGERATRIAARIQEELAAFRARAADDDVSLLERRDRDGASFRTHLQGIAARANVGPRAAPIADERLLRVVADPHAREEVRAAAAATLHYRIRSEAPSGAADDRREALRRVASETASPRLRIAIESAADGREDALDEALEDVSESARVVGRR